MSQKFVTAPPNPKVPIKKLYNRRQHKNIQGHVHWHMNNFTTDTRASDTAVMANYITYKHWLDASSSFLPNNMDPSQKSGLKKHKTL